MKFLTIGLAVVLLVSAAGCGSEAGGSALMGRLPQGYHMYIAFDPEAMDLDGILETLEENLPEDVLENAEDSDMVINPFNWSEWKEGMGLRDGEIGIVALTEDEDLVAIFLPCTDQAKLESFVEENDFGDTEYFPYGDYTVMVINWDDDDLLDDLEDALGEATLSADNGFTSMQEAASLDGSYISILFTDEITEVPVYGVFGSDNSESVLKVTVTVDDNDVQQYVQMVGNGLQSNSIVFPEKTMAAVRFTIDMDKAIQQYTDMAGDSDESGFAEIEAGLPFIGFDSMEEFLSVFQGDFCITIQNLEIDEQGDPENMEGIMAISLADAEKFESSLAAVSLIAESDREEIDNVVTYRIEKDGESLWYFISEDVFYVTMNVHPEDIMDGVSAGDYFQGVASEGFLGGAVDPEGIMQGIQAEDDVEEIITTLFENRAIFSVSMEGNTITSTTVAGPDVLKSLVSLASVFASHGDIPEVDLY